MKHANHNITTGQALPYKGYRLITSLALIAFLSIAITGCGAAGVNRATVLQTIDKNQTGDILADQGDHGLIVIDRGQSSGLQRGDRFAVYNAADTGGKERKAVINVFDVREFDALCRVEIRYEPLKPGDWCLRIDSSPHGSPSTVIVPGPGN